MARILIADDTTENLYLLQTLLAGFGHEVDETRDGVQALAQARRARPDLLVTDLLMPVMDGYALCRAWRADPSLATVPIIIYTSTYTDPRDQQLGFDAGADAYLIKPTEPERLLQVIRDVLAKKRQDRSDLHRPAPAGAEVFLREYNSTLVRKLEDKLAQLDAANRQLMDAQVFLRAVFDSLPAHVVVVDTAGTIVSASQSSARLATAPARHSLTAEMLAGANYAATLRSLGDAPRAGIRRVSHAVDELLAGRISEFTEEFSVRVDGQPRACAVTGSPLRSSPGTVVLTHVDVTDRRELEEAVLSAASDEQHRLGMDLHDGLGQELTGLSLMLAALARRTAHADAALAEELTNLATMAGRSMESARAIAHGLSPVGTSRGGFGDALDALAHSTTTMLGAAVALEFPSRVQKLISPDVAEHLYRIIQEAISNAVKHGHATDIRVVFQVVNEEIQLTITDNGRGLPPTGAGDGRGQRIMKYRAKTIRGTLDFSAGSQGGVVISCVFPAPEVQREHAAGSA
jgi:PAS domain S-box-containing protein